MKRMNNSNLSYQNVQCRYTRTREQRGTTANTSSSSKTGYLIVMICVGKNKRLSRSNLVNTGLQASRTKRTTIPLTHDKEGNNNEP